MMHHPEFLLIPPLMLLDYFLTVAGARLADRGHRQHFKSPHYELNPVWQKSIASRRWFNPKHLIVVSLFAILCVALAAMPATDAVIESYVETLFGCLVTIFTTINAFHLSNLLTFRRLNRHPGEVAGEVVLAHSYMLSVTQYRILNVLLPMGVAAYFVPSPFLVGGVEGLVTFLIVMSIWRLRKPKPIPPPQ